MSEQGKIRQVCGTCGAVLRPSVAPTFDNIIQNLHGRRAIEVALTGKHEIAFVGNTDAAKVLAEIARWHGVTSFQLLPCPCGNYGDALLACQCSIAQIRRYRQARSYQALLGADIFIETERPDANRPMKRTYQEPLERVLERVEAAQPWRERINVPSAVEDLTDAASRSLMLRATQQLHLDTLAIQAILRVGHSIASLVAGANKERTSILPAHLAEALQYRLRSEYSNVPALPERKKKEKKRA